MPKGFSLAVALTIATTTAAFAGDAAPSEPAGGEYKQVSTLVALPEFIPGMGSLYVDPATLPAGPFAAYDKRKKLVASIYMVPIADMQAKKKFEGLAVSGSDAHSLDLYYNAGHPGVDTPHYHIVVWHVDPAKAVLK